MEPKLLIDAVLDKVLSPLAEILDSVVVPFLWDCFWSAIYIISSVALFLLFVSSILGVTFYGGYLATGHFRRYSASRKPDKPDEEEDLIVQACVMVMECVTALGVFIFEVAPWFSGNDPGPGLREVATVMCKASVESVFVVGFLSEIIVFVDMTRSVVASFKQEKESGLPTFHKAFRGRSKSA